MCEPFWHRCRSYEWCSPLYLTAGIYVWSHEEVFQARALSTPGQSSSLTVCTWGPVRHWASARISLAPDGGRYSEASSVGFLSQANFSAVAVALP